MRSEAVFPRADAADARAFYLQGVFRAALDALARPGELHRLPEPPEPVRAFAERAGISPWALELADVFLDSASSFAVPGGPGDESGARPACPAVARALAERTHAAMRPVEEAAFCFLALGLADGPATAALGALSAGTLLAPHLGATCVVECAWLAGLDRDDVAAGGPEGEGPDAPPAASWELSGPGIAGSAPFSCDRGAILEARNERADEFPCGVDLFFVDGTGRLAGLPRSTVAVERDGVGAWAM